VPPPVNSIVENPGFQNGIPKTWLPFGTCDLTISGDQQYIIAANRQQTFAGPSWDVTNLVRQGNFYRLARSAGSSFYLLGRKFEFCESNSRGSFCFLKGNVFRDAANPGESNESFLHS
jgi:hypothetical protein